MRGARSCLAFLAACAGRGPVDGAVDAFVPPVPSFPEACPSAPCAAATAVSSTAELVAIIDRGEDWPLVSARDSGCVPATDDVAIRGRIRVSIDDLRLFTGCGADCKQYSGFWRPGDPRVRCLDGATYSCHEVEIEDATVRFRKYHSHALITLSIAVVEILGACGSACGPGAAVCEQDHSCWADIQSHCRYCLGARWDLCECWDGERLAADGTSCKYWLSLDAATRGSCVAGLCQRAPRALTD